MHVPGSHMPEEIMTSGSLYHFVFSIYLLSAGKDMRVTADSLARVTTFVRQSFSFRFLSFLSFSQTEVAFGEREMGRSIDIREIQLIDR